MSALLLATLLAGYSPVAPPVSKLPRWTFELRLTPYSPQISDNPVNEDLFRNVMFKKANHSALFENRPIMWGLGLDHYLWTRLGLLGLGGSVGYWRVTGHTRVCHDIGGGASHACDSAGDAANPDISEKGNSEQSLSIIPFSFGGVWRVDTAYRDYGVPLIPYVKAGLNWNIWSIRVNGDLAKTQSGHDAHGGVLGWYASGGLELNIDWLEPGNQTRSSTSPTGSYIFAEATWIRGDDFNNHPIIDPSDFAILGGVALDFN